MQDLLLEIALSQLQVIFELCQVGVVLQDLQSVVLGPRGIGSFDPGGLWLWHVAKRLCKDVIVAVFASFSICFFAGRFDDDIAQCNLLIGLRLSFFFARGLRFLGLWESRLVYFALLLGFVEGGHNVRGTGGLCCAGAH